MFHALVPHASIFAIVKAVGYPGLFSIIFLESGVPFGFFLPGASMLFTAGLLASKGFFNPWVLVPLVTLGAILGDNAGYWFGKKVGIRVFSHTSIRFFDHEHVERAKRFYDERGTYTVFLARFIPVVRTFVPIVAGAVEMRYRTFLTYNILGALVWAAGTTLLGYYLGERVPFVQQYFAPIILIIIIITTVPLFFQFNKERRREKNPSRS